MVKEMINEDRLLKLIPNFFQRPEQVVIEICQNAQRSRSSRVEINYDSDERTLEFQDNGVGASDCLPLFVLAESDWSDDNIEQENPAGWGNFFLISISKDVTYKSDFGSIVVDCERFLNDREYRQNLLELVDTGDTHQGFHGLARLKTPIDIDKIKGELRYFDCEVVLNGKIIEADINEITRKNIVCTYEDNDVYINVERWHWNSRHRFPDRLSVIWYGIPIGINEHKDKAVTINVKSGSPLTPVLPYRRAIKEDEKLERFYAFCIKKVVEYCIEKVNGSDETGYQLETYMKILGWHGSQEELDSLSQYYILSYQPFSERDWQAEGKTEFIKRPKTGNAVIKSKVLKEVVDHDGKVIKLSEDLVVLPDGVFEVKKLPKRHPSWLCIQTEDYVLRINRDESKEPYRGNYIWVEAKITLEGEGGATELKCVATVSDYNELSIYYSESAMDAHEIADALFNRSYYDSDGDTYDTQQYYFLADLQEDISNIEKKYDRGALFSGLSPYIKIYDLREIKISRNKMLVTLKGGAKKVFALK